MTEQALAVRDLDAPMQRWSVPQVMEQIRLIQEVMRQAMKEGEHFGVIPGTQKPTLLKPGAEKLCLTFRFYPDYEVLPSSVLREDFILHDIRCRLIHIPTQAVVGTGLGSCNSREDKYQWRTAARLCPTCKKETIIKGKEEYGGGWLCHKKQGGCGAKFKDGDAVIEDQKVGKVKNANIWNENNTIEKMACKRALVAAILNATAASDIFTQDLEDVQEGNGKHSEEPVKEKEAQGEKTVITIPQWKKDGKPHPHAGKPITDLLTSDLSTIMEGLRADPKVPSKAKDQKYQPLLEALENELERRITEEHQAREPKPPDQGALI